MILDEIVEKRKEQLQREMDNFPLEDMKEMALNSKNKNYGFKEALQKDGLSIIAEVKKASPSRGVIAEEFRPVETALAYEEAGAAAISCLTEEHYFKGGSKYFADIRAKVDLPMLRKDFIIDPYQIYEAKVLGADAVLLIAAILSEEKMKEFYELAKSLGLDCLAEVHNEEELKQTTACKCDIIGINNRNLKTFEVDLNTTSKLAPKISYEAVLVSESGMMTKEDLLNVRKQGADGALIGEAFMRADNIQEMMKELRSSL
ncbi:indole-3-glycerol phosphate synthase TrpC [Anaerostipes butyraticus]|uniref:Indole-3-glycerol phosphate synthase n=1 Tax=Anaerostipes butyraticus TaxID=645466 RepID=A0A916VE92_9FIRM|nr:indole-3-glycerol phosphate synthase TrpC [Anaerostipes butyraticus]GFO86511.1 indole-3-glycerol phosphate synthase [Anaerostipes butyraticus]